MYLSYDSVGDRLKQLNSLIIKKDIFTKLYIACSERGDLVKCFSNGAFSFTLNFQFKVGNFFLDCKWPLVKFVKNLDWKAF